MSWYAPLRNIASKGSTADSPGGLAGLHAARQIHQGQFFTPDEVAAFMWKIALKAMKNLVQPNSELVSIYDNSIGSGRLIQYADPLKHALYGCDVDKAVVQALNEATLSAGFSRQIESVGMESIRAHHMDIALINPPFSLHFESPTLETLPCCTHGRFGPNTSAISDAYALDQALRAASVVIALLPTSYTTRYVNSASRSKRLTHVFTLPRGTFSEEGTEVAVSVLVFDGSHLSAPVVHSTLSTLTDDLPDFKLEISNWGKPTLTVLGIDTENPSIKLPVTGIKTVRVAHDGRKIKLGYQCGLIEAKVANAVLISTVASTKDEKHRTPKGVIFNGDGLLDVEMHAAQPDPLASFESFLQVISASGGIPEVDTGLVNYLKKRARQVNIELTPLRHEVQGKLGAQPSTGTAFKTFLVNPDSWASPLIKAGQVIEFIPRSDGMFDYNLGNSILQIKEEELVKRFEIQLETAAQGWSLAHAGRAVAFPARANQLRRYQVALGIDKWLSWDYQSEDAIEVLISPKGCIVAWEQALGKARLSAALCLMGGLGPGVIAMPAHLILETAKEFAKIKLDPALWQIIEQPDQLKALRRINLISLSRLRMPILAKKPRQTYAKLLRRRVSTLVIDEGEFLSNADSLQSKALAQVSAKKKFILSGTPLGNYPRDILPLMAFVGGDGTAGQRYGLEHGYLNPKLKSAQRYAERGITIFKDKFVSMEWSTNEFNEDLRNGAKREIPRIRNVTEYREMLAPWVMRRLVAEPAVAQYIKLKPPQETVTEVPWDAAHLSHYLSVAEEFSDWYKKQSGEKNNLVALLARINAVVMAANYPQHESEFGRYAQLTSKQKFALARLKELASQGHRTILFAHNPGVLELLAMHLREDGGKPILLHGGLTIAARTKNLNEGFRDGNSPWLLASYGVTQSGYNIPQANKVIMYSRDWRFKVENQAIRRTLRVDQQKDVSVEYLHLTGGIDEYQAQMVGFKQEAAAAGLDWGTPEKEGQEFLHLDTLLGRFCVDLASRLSLDSAQTLRAHLKANSTQELIHA